MQSLSWYIKRLSTMSAGEILWRVQGKLQDTTDGVLLPWRSSSQPLQQFAHSVNPRDAVDATLFGDWFAKDPLVDSPQSTWAQSLLAHAERLASGHLDLFDLENLEVGSQIEWNYDYKAKKRSALVAAPRVDYRDYPSVGDCKFVWEPNRHQHWVVLARAYRCSKDERFAQVIVDQFDSWVENCPFGRGMNWRSPLELGIRLISWTWAFALIDDSPAMTDERRERLIRSVNQHLCEISRKFSRYTSANNHLVGEAAGVFIASSYFSGLKGSDGWREESQRILAEEIQRQTFADGATKEQATGYHLFSFEFFVLAGLIARNAGRDFDGPYWSRIEKMIEFIAGMSEAGSAMPMIGDADDGYVLDLGNRSEPEESAVALGALLFGRGDFKKHAGKPRENGYWLLGPACASQWDSINCDDQPLRLVSRKFPDSGYFILQDGPRGSSRQTSVLMDAGPLGFLAIAAHGHADALSLVIRAAGHDILVDPGTYDYFTYPPWREHFRSTRAHNTVEIDGQNQSQMLGAFMWGQRAETRCVQWSPNEHGGTMVAEHTGYTHLSDPVTHRRSVVLDGTAHRIEIVDDLQMQGRHDVAVFWHFAEQCKIVSEDKEIIEIDFGGGRLFMELDQRLTHSRERGNEATKLGWVSRGYHRKTPSLTLVARGSFSKDTSIRTRIRIETPAKTGAKSNQHERLETAGTGGE